MVKDSSYTLADVRVGEEDGIPFVETEGTEDFDLRAVMECGQCFRFTPVAGTSHRCEYSGVAYGRFISVAEDEGTLRFYNTDIQEFGSLWIGYFGLDTD